MFKALILNELVIDSPTPTCGYLTHAIESFRIETVCPEGTFCDTVQVPSGAGDMQLI